MKRGLISLQDCTLRTRQAKMVHFQSWAKQNLEVRYTGVVNVATGTVWRCPSPSGCTKISGMPADLPLYSLTFLY